MNDLLLLVTILVAILDWLAVWQGWRRVGYLAKPLTIILLFTWLVLKTWLQGTAVWFGIGLLFSLAGDVFLMFSPRFFLAGLTSFSLVHLAYLAGFLIPLPENGYLEVLVAGIAIAVVATFVIQKITKAQFTRGYSKLVRPTLFYGMLISLMLLSALWTIFRADWFFWNSIMVSLGAVLFYSSDLMNAWIRYVNPYRKGRVMIMVTYHLGQILIITGMMLNWYPDLMV
jgi:uncharacterized membrane protein YhhN